MEKSLRLSNVVRLLLPQTLYSDVIYILPAHFIPSLLFLWITLYF